MVGPTKERFSTQFLPFLSCYMVRQDLQGSTAFGRRLVATGAGFGWFSNLTLQAKLSAGEDEIIPAPAGCCKEQAMHTAIRNFLNDEDGAVTVDWVVITAGICALVITLFTFLQTSSYEAAATGIRDRVTEATTIGTTP
jgi:Flp pilus assembly pilin Flp